MDRIDFKNEEYCEFHNIEYIELAECFIPKNHETYYNQYVIALSYMRPTLYLNDGPMFKNKTFKKTGSTCKTLPENWIAVV